MNESLSQAILRFNLAQQALDRATQDLNAVVQTEMGKRSTSDDLHDLVDDLPRSYRGSRRIHEAIIRLQDLEKIDKERQAILAEATKESHAKLRSDFLKSLDKALGE